MVHFSNPWDRVEGKTGQAAMDIMVSRLVCKSDFTNRMCVGVSMRPGRSQGGIRAAWLLKSPSMAILPYGFNIL